MSTILTVALAPALAVAGAIGAMYGSRREHTQWLRDTRRVAYEALLTSVTRVQTADVLKLLIARTMNGLPAAPPASREAIESELSKQIETYAELFSAVSAVQVAGPAAVAQAAVSMKNAVTGSDNVALTKADEAFVLLARATLGSE